MPRIRKGRDPFTLLTLGSLALCSGALLALYAEGAIEARGLVSGLAVTSGAILAAFGTLRLRYPWLAVKGRWHLALGVALSLAGLALLLGPLAGLALSLMALGAASLAAGLRRLRARGP